MSTLAGIQFEIQIPGEPVPVTIVGVDMHAESFAQRQVSHRKKEITSPWVGGSFVTLSVREQVQEQVSFWVDGEDHLGTDPGKSLQQRMQERLDLLCSALDQLSYAVDVSIGDQVYRWDCSVADYTIETNQPMLEATLALVKATIPRSPSAVRSTR